MDIKSYVWMCTLLIKNIDLGYQTNANAEIMSKMAISEYNLNLNTEWYTAVNIFSARSKEGRGSIFCLHPCRPPYRVVGKGVWTRYVCIARINVLYPQIPRIYITYLYTYNNTPAAPPARIVDREGKLFRSFRKDEGGNLRGGMCCGYNETFSFWNFSGFG